MIVDAEAADDGSTPVWKCLGCGRSVYLDRARQAEDEQLQEKITRSLREHPRPDPP
jgi:hypothetical protein